MDRAAESIVMSRPDHGCRRLTGKNAVVTAGTKGIGRAIVERLLQEGARVFLCSRKAENVQETLDAVRAEDKSFVVGGEACNVGDADALTRFVESAVNFFPERRIDILVSNAGVNPRAGPTLDMSDEIFDKIFTVNVKSYFQLVRRAEPFLGAGASVLFVSSVGGHQPSPPLGLYGVSKTAVIALARVLAAELGPKGVRVNSLCPGVVRTKMSEALWAGDADGAQARRASFLGRYGDPVEMAGIAAFLCSEDASFVTGESLVASGGVMSRL